MCLFWYTLTWAGMPKSKPLLTRNYIYQHSIFQIPSFTVIHSTTVWVITYADKYTNRKHNRLQQNISGITMMIIIITITKVILWIQHKHGRDQPKTVPVIIEIVLCLGVCEIDNSTLSSPNYLVPYHHLIHFLLHKHHLLKHRFTVLCCVNIT